MDEFQQYQQQFLDKLEEIRQQLNYCLNNYDFHHKGNEYDILQEQLDTINKGSKELLEFIDLVHKVKEKTKAAQAMCDQVDELMANLPDEKDEDAMTGGSESIEEDERKESVKEDKKSPKLPKKPFSLKEC